MKRSLFFFLSLAFALILFVVFLVGNQSSRSIGVLPMIVFAVVMLCVGGFFLYIQHKGKDADSIVMAFQPVPKNRWGKVIFASLGASLALSLLMLIFAFFIFNYDVVVGYVKQNFLKHILIIQLICIPVLQKYLK